ncbi:MAG: NAD(P)/FAD-dependent oxidoreductase [Planctomycetes bacterium]|nr:NAD(P)/FAD-dependent oxidoreductase [Planctomycetota bacterium]
MTTENCYDAIIIGAGMSGLAAGIRLAMFDKRVCVLERHYVWGGLNSFYNFKGHQFDVGLHAMTNYAPKGARGLPLTRLLKQLRIRWHELDLHQQSFSRVSFPSAQLKFSNDFELLRSEIAAAFPSQIDGFDNLTRQVDDFNELDLNAPQQDARKIVESCITDPLLVDMLFCPLMFYGSARENEMDWDQFVVMFKSIYLEGFSRPAAGVRHVLKLLTSRFRNAGGEMRLSTGVAKILTEGGKAVGVQLDDGSQLTANTILSSAGLVETSKLCCGVEFQSAPVGKLSFTETINVLDKPAKELGIKETITFFSNNDKFNYACPEEAVDTSSGVICMPGNFDLPNEPKDHLIRITNIANFDIWNRSAAVPAAPPVGIMPTGTIDNPKTYNEHKQYWYNQSCNEALKHIPDFRPHTTLVDMFTPTTVKRFTGHERGAVYGSPTKLRTGETGVGGLYIMGTDQGFLGIIGAALSGISMANRWVLQVSVV